MTYIEIKIDPPPLQGASHRPEEMNQEGQ